MKTQNKVLLIIYITLFLSIILLVVVSAKDIIHKITFTPFLNGEIKKSFWREHQGECVELQKCRDLSNCPEGMKDSPLTLCLPEYPK